MSAMNVKITAQKNNHILTNIDVKKEATKRGINEKCLNAIIAFYKEKQRFFSSYSELKTYGKDTLSDQDLAALMKNIEHNVIAQMKTYFSGKELASCLRWHLRGLSTYDAIRKVLVDSDISMSIEKKNQPKLQ